MPPPPSRETVTLSGDLRLVPVVEFVPGSYARQERPLPEGSIAEAPMDWQRYWEQCLADSGLLLEPLHPGSRLVPVSRLTDPHVLRELLRVEMKSSDPEETALLERVAPMSGGQALLEGENVVLTPRCCGDLRNLDSWEDSARLHVDGFWIGHPQVYAAWEEPWLLLREDEPDNDGVHRAWHLSPLVLARAASAARKEQEDFARRLVPVLLEQFPPEVAHPLASKLAGLGTPHE
jgi:hypothetical protein